MFDSSVGDLSGAPVLSTGELCALVDHLQRVTIAHDDTESITQIEALERIKSSAAAMQAQITVSFAGSRRASLEPERARAREERRSFPHPEASIGAEVGLARRESPHQGRRHLELAEALTHDLPHTLVALSRGDISEERALIIATETESLSAEDRRAVDAKLHDPHSGVGHGVVGLGDRELRDLVRRVVYRVDHEGVTGRWDRARARRRVTTRNLGDGTTRISAIVKQEHAASAVLPGGRCRLGACGR